MTRKPFYLFVLLIFISANCIAQLDSGRHKLPIDLKYQKKSTKKIAYLHIGVYGSSMFLLNQAWYKNYPKSKFHTFNDISEWQQIDKMGHAFSAYTMSQYSTDLWKSTGMDRQKTIWLGGLTGAAYQTIIEVLDGYSKAWGWSWGDIIANGFGSTLFISQEFVWHEQRIQFKTSFHKKKYSDAALNQRSDELFGKSLAERCLKDYNGQTYWLSANIHAFFPQTHVPDWLQISLGTGAEGMFGANNNLELDDKGIILFDRTNINRYRQWYLAPDINFTKIKTNRKAIKTVLYILNCLKFPTPSIEYSNASFKLNWIHF